MLSDNSQSVTKLPATTLCGSVRNVVNMGNIQQYLVSHIILLVAGLIIKYMITIVYTRLATGAPEMITSSLFYMILLECISNLIACVSNYINDTYIDPAITKYSYEYMFGLFSDADLAWLHETNHKTPIHVAIPNAVDTMHSVIHGGIHLLLPIGGIVVQIIVVVQCTGLQRGLF